MGKCKFNNDWLQRTDENGNIVSTWCTRYKDDTKGYCKLCQIVFNISKGFQAITQHSNSNKHITIAKSTLSGQMVLTRTNIHSANVGDNNHLKVPAQVSSVLSLCNTKELITRAELIWTMKVVISNYSAASCKDVSNIFQAMFSDSESIAKHFKLSPSKVHYLITDGLAPYFFELMLEEAQSTFYSISYDETTNVEDKKEFQLLIRFWSSKSEEVVSRHLKTVFLGKSDGETLHNNIISILEDSNLSLSKLLMVGSDGPNVNKKVFRLLNEEILSCRKKGLINIGTCNLHIVHNAYLKGMECFGEEASDFLISVYYYFDGWPSRAEELTNVQNMLNKKNQKFLKHSPSRWLTFGMASERLLDQWDVIIYYFLKYIPKNKNSASKMQTSSYKKIVNCINNTFLKAELYFAKSSADIFTTFTLLFQKDEPLIHLLHSEIKALLQKIMGRICKPEIITQLLNSNKKLSKQDIELDVFTHSNLLDLYLIPLTEEIKTELAKFCEKDRKHCLKLMQSHYKAACSHLLEKSCITDNLVKSFGCLSPENRFSSKSCYDISVIAKALPIDIPGDVLIDEWKLLQLDENVNSNLRIDKYWNDLLNKKNALNQKMYPNLETVVKSILTLWHSQANVERGFSISRWALTEDRAAMSERTLNAILTIKDAVLNYDDPSLVPITNKMLKYGQNAYKNYEDYLENQKLEAKNKQEKYELDQKLKNDMEDREKKAVKSKEKLINLEETLKEKKNQFETSKETTHTLIKEATERLKTALKRNDLKEASLAQAMLEGANKLEEGNGKISDDVKRLEQTIKKRKDNLLSTYENYNKTFKQ